ncbi:MAG: 3-oxoacid CoA-transferase subunit A [Chloroflexi bacterium]|nr:3-oxoacid CoA-transferase subunit A [Chloroflexota bacterium]MBV9892797.1 3-oxoacid CoA-transferase subunit A [Chloroflexota bacterium]
MDKVVASPADAVADIPDGASIAISGFGLSSGVPNSLLAAAAEQGAKDLCLVANGVGGAAAKLIENNQVSKLIVSFTARPNIESAAAEKAAAGHLTYEMVPQGTLVERLRAGGAGLGGIFTPTGVSTPIANDKEVRFFDGKAFIFEPAIKVDYAFVCAYRADRLGNCEFRGSAQHFNPSFAKGARIAIVEVDEIVEPGAIDPHRVGLPGSFVARVVKRTIQPDRSALARFRRAPDSARTYNGKSAWTRHQMAEKAASLLPEPGYVNLGLGIPTLVANYLKGRDILLHGENGILGYGPPAAEDQVDWYVHDAGGNYVTERPGVAYFDSVTAFEMVRSGKIDVVVLGAYQVDEAGNVANWSTPEQVGGGIGGAMDMVAGGATVMILMEHRDSRDRAKLVRSCTYPLTGAGCVSIVVTDLAVLRRRDGRFVIEDVAPGFTEEEVAALTEMDVSRAPV